MGWFGTILNSIKRRSPCLLQGFLTERGFCAGGYRGLRSVKYPWGIFGLFYKGLDCADMGL